MEEIFAPACDPDTYLCFIITIIIINIVIVYTVLFTCVRHIIAGSYTMVSWVGPAQGWANGVPMTGVQDYYTGKQSTIDLYVLIPSR